MEKMELSEALKANASVLEENVDLYLPNCLILLSCYH